MWLISCGRKDLRGKLHNLTSYRLCSVHFEERMYINFLRNRLLPAAMPTIFPSSSDSQRVEYEHDYSRPIQTRFQTQVHPKYHNRSKSPIRHSVS